MPRLPGLNVQAPWARLLVDGQKTIETRTYPLPQKYVGAELWLIETPGPVGKFKARVIGRIRFTECKQYKSSDEFKRDFDLHRVSANDSRYSWKPGKEKYGWTVGSIRSVRPFSAPTPRGIVFVGPFERKA